MHVPSTSAAPRVPGYRLSVAIVWLAGALVPSRSRAVWRREWLSELWHARERLARSRAVPSMPGRSRTSLVRRSLGSIRHALWIRGRNWSYHVLTRDLRYASRSLLKSPAFTAVAVLTMALGIGANAAVFNLANALLLQPYPYTEPDRIVRVGAFDQKTGRAINMSFPDTVDVEEHATTLASVALADREPYNVGDGAETTYVQGAQVTASLFEVLGTTPLLGRTFSPDEEGPDSPRVVVLGEALWRSSFGGDPDVVGSEIVIDGEPHVVIGVVPVAGGYPDGARLWVPVRFDPAAQRRSTRWANVIARLSDGATVEQARDELGSLATSLAQTYPDSNADIGFRLVSLREMRTADYLQVLPLMLGVVGAVLLIACANVAGLILSRGAVRAREFALRAALGAGRVRIVRQLLAESGLIAGAGTILGFAVGVWTVGTIMASAPIDIPDWIDVTPDWRVMGATAGVAIVAVFLAGLAPALRASRSDPSTALKEAHGEPGAGRHRTRTALIVAEVALSIVLLVTAGLLIRSLQATVSTDTGYDTEHAFMLTTAFADTTYGDPQDRLAFYRAARDRLLAIPGVEAVGGIAQPPLRGGWSVMPFQVDGREPSDEGREDGAFLHAVTPGYIGAAGIGLLRGRDLTEQDSAPEAADAAMINRGMAERYWPDGDALGARFRFSYMPEGTWITVVGVVENTKQRSVTDAVEPEIFYPYERWAEYYGRMTWMVRAAGDPTALMAAAQAEVRSLDPNQALYDVMTLREAVDESIWMERFFTLLFVAFGGIALLMAAVGLYGLIAYTTSRRTHEIGVRIALGASGGDVLGTVLRRTTALAGIGSTLGLFGAFAVSRLLGGMLYHVSPSDPSVYAVVVAVMAAVSIAAGLLPALRATRVDPIDALRTE